MQVPLATYRVQFHCRFPFEHLLPYVEYLEKLGISHLYCSPIFQAQRQSCHGYDVVDHSRINDELGGETAFIKLSQELRACGMSIVLDVVPNHMGIGDTQNRWWYDVLENGPSSPYAKYFDIDWDPPKEELRHRVLLPILGDQYGTVLENQQLQLHYEGGAFCVRYFDHQFPIAPRPSRMILELTLDKLRGRLDSESLDLMELESIITSLQRLPLRTDLAPHHVAERRREKEVAKRRLNQLCQQNDTIRGALAEAVEQMNGIKGVPESFNLLQRLLAEQAYRLCYWRVAADEINYRRFFDVNELAAIRVELPEVFIAVHQLVFRLMAEGHVSALRIDHPDGLLRPEQYFNNLQAGTLMLQEGRLPAKGDFPAKQTQQNVWVAVEKILEPHEQLHRAWAVSGTTGYDFLNQLNGIFVRRESGHSMNRVYSTFTRSTLNFGLLVYSCKKLILDVAMSGELHVLARRLDQISEQHRSSRDFTLWSLQEALSEIIACFPVYRTYVHHDDAEVGPDDRHHITMAIRAAKRRNPSISPSLYDFIGAVLLLEDPDGLTEAQRFERRDFVVRFQQFTGPVMAKGLEDTAFYRAYPLASLNEVGGNPGRFGLSIDEFHKANMERAQHWPNSMLATSTHDTKRSEDVRARLNVLSELPAQWGRSIRRWHGLNSRFRQQVEGIHVPEPNEEYLFYQTLVGTWPLEDVFDRDDYEQRLQAYVRKAAREAKVHTTWVNPNEQHEEAVASFVHHVINSGEFIDEFRSFFARIAFPSAVNSLAQVVLKSTCPGVPDFYQGTELWDFSLVDPDNRRPVDFEVRSAALRDIQTRAEDPQLPVQLLRSWRDGRVKLFVTWKTLQLRRLLPMLFQRGDYLPLTVEGECAEHVCAFARRVDQQAMVVIVPRLVARLGVKDEWIAPSVWESTAVVGLDKLGGRWKNIFADATLDSAVEGAIPVSAALETFPVAVLVSAR